MVVVVVQADEPCAQLNKEGNCNPPSSCISPCSLAHPSKILRLRRAVLYTTEIAPAVPYPRPVVLLRMREMYFYYISTMVVCLVRWIIVYIVRTRYIYIQNNIEIVLIGARMPLYMPYILFKGFNRRLHLWSFVERKSSKFLSQYNKTK